MKELECNKYRYRETVSNRYVCIDRNGRTVLQESQDVSKLTARRRLTVAGLDQTGYVEDGRGT